MTRVKKSILANKIRGLAQFWGGRRNLEAPIYKPHPFCYNICET